MCAAGGFGKTASGFKNYSCHFSYNFGRISAPSNTAGFMMEDKIQTILDDISDRLTSMEACLPGRTLTEPPPKESRNWLGFLKWKALTAKAGHGRKDLRETE
jgi:hypothetical protein